MNKTNNNNNLTKKITQIGGKKIGKGGFSCVIKPAIRCKKTKKANSLYQNTISKLTKSSALTSNYKNVNSKLAKLDPNQDYFIHYLNSCMLKDKDVRSRLYKDIKYSDIDIDDANKYLLSDINDFDELQCELDKKEKYVNIIEKYGGESLYKIILYKTINIKPKINDIITHLLNGLQLLHTNNIVHRDIKIDNITIDDSKFKSQSSPSSSQLSSLDTQLKSQLRFIPKYIDFNNSFIASEINKISVVGNYSYNISLDYLIYFYLYIFITKKGYEFNIALIKKISKLCNNTIKSSNKTLSNINISYTSLLTVENGYLKKKKDNKIRVIEQIKFNGLIMLIYKDFKKQKNPLEYFKNFIVFANDVYGLGIVFKILYRKYSLRNNKLFNLIDKMTNLNPKHRYTINEALNFWETGNKSGIKKNSKIMTKKSRKKTNKK
jgi:serine/threonine protein kinase